MTAVWIVLGLGVIVIVWAIATYNRFVSLEKQKEEAWSGVLVQLKRRHDLVPNLVNTVKGYATHEKGLLEDLTKMRAMTASTSPETVAQSEQGFSRLLGRLFAVAENYPDLKASQNFIELQDQMAKLEDEIQMARRYFNGTVRNFNTLVASFPSLIIARMFSYKEGPYFELESEAETAVPSVSF